MTDLARKNIKSQLKDEDDFEFLMSEDVFDTGKPLNIDVEFDKYEAQYAVGKNALDKRVLGWFRDSAVQSYEDAKYQESINFCDSALEPGMRRFHFFTGVFEMIAGLCSEQLMLYHTALERYGNALLEFKMLEEEENDKYGKEFCERQVGLIEDRLRFIRTISSELISLFMMYEIKVYF